MAPTQHNPDRGPPRVPDGERVYAIGDVHGRIDLLEQLHGCIEEDAAGAEPAAGCSLVYLGDYVDRGADSRPVIEALAMRPLAGFRCVHLKGNHEDFLLAFLDDATMGGSWFLNGGAATVASYGVETGAPAFTAHGFEAAQAGLRAAMPAAHLEFLRRLALRHVVGDYAFVHAGVQPGLALEAQRENDLLWIREPFLGSDEDFGHVVVHGHTPAPQPVVRANRIGIDTGAFYTGRLTCLVLDGAGVRFLHT
jgi:serine/threonine protein phosphatase 1